VTQRAAPDPVTDRRTLIAIVLIGAAWSLSSLGYYWLLPAVDAEIGYVDAPLTFSVYYLGWAALALWVFHDDLSRWVMRRGPRQSRTLPILLVFAFAFYAMFLLPRLPEIDLATDDLPETMLAATSAWFLPKSFEILFQQILIAALVLALHTRNLTLKQLSFLTALLFGGFHLTLGLSGENWFYVTRFTVAATIFGAFVPHLILRVPSGFILSYALHWSFYAVDLAIGHVMVSGGAP
jgi:hypothetical protein